MPSFQRRLQTPLARPAHIRTHKLLYTATKVQPESTQCKISGASSNRVMKRLTRISSIFVLLVSNDILPVSGIILPVSGSVTASFGCHDYTQVGNVGLLTVGEHKSPQVGVGGFSLRSTTQYDLFCPPSASQHACSKAESSYFLTHSSCLELYIQPSHRPMHTHNSYCRLRC